MAAELLYGECGRLGLAIHLARFRARVGGDAALKKILGALTVKEKMHPGRPRGMSGAVRHAYYATKIGGEDFLVIPRVKGAPLLRARTRDGAPLLDGVRAAPALCDDGSQHANAPLPVPRRLEAFRLVANEPLYEYQEAAIEFLCGAPVAGGPEAPVGGPEAPVGGPEAPVSGPEAPVGGPEATSAQPGATTYLQMDTGLGKTRVGCAFVARCGEPALVVVPTDAIAHQWVDEFAEIYPEMRVAVFHNPPRGSRKVPPNPQTHDVVLIIVNTFREKEPSFMEGFGALILDEAHEYHSAHNSRALWLAQTRAVLGLSATPEERPDGLDRYVHLHLGSVALPKNIPGFDVCAVNFRGAVRVVEYAGHPAHCDTATTPAGTMSAIMTIGNVIKDAARMRMVAAEVDRLFHLHERAPAAELESLGLGPRPASAATPTHPAGEIRRHGVFVFAETREYLPALRAALLERMSAADIIAPELDTGSAARATTASATAPSPVTKVSILRGGVAKTAVGDARRARAHIVLTTYGFSRRGISLPDMTAIVEATPRRNGMRQILGRILRRGSDESIIRQVVDVVDARTGLRGQLSDRRKIYQEKKYPISKVSASFQDFAEPGAAASIEDIAAAGAGDDEELSEMTLDDLLAAARGDGQSPEN